MTQKYNYLRLFSTSPFFWATFSIAIVTALNPHFLWEMDQNCDSWLYFGFTELFDIAFKDNSNIFSYRTERLPSALTKRVLYLLFGYFKGKYIFAWSAHYLSLKALDKILKLKFSQTTQLCSMIFFAFHPLVFGSLNNDYIAIDLYLLCLWTLYFTLKIPNQMKAPKIWGPTIKSGFFWGLTFFNHFKIGLYAVFIPLLVYLSPFKERTERNFTKHTLGFAIGFFISIALAAIAFFILTDGQIFFFKDQLELTFTDESDANRISAAILKNSPLFTIYSTTIILIIYLAFKRKWNGILTSISMNLFVHLMFILFGGSYFVESNYLWGLLPTALVLPLFIENTYKNLPLPQSSLPIIFGLTGTLFFVPNFNLHTTLYAKVGWGYLIAQFLLLLIITILCCFAKNNSLKKGAHLVLLLFILNLHSLSRPDEGYGPDLFLNYHRQEGPREVFHKIHTYLENVATNKTGSIPIMYTKIIGDTALDRFQMSMTQCGGERMAEFGKKTELLNEIFHGQRPILFVSKSPSPNPLVNEMQNYRTSVTLVETKKIEETPPLYFMYFKPNPKHSE